MATPREARAEVLSTCFQHAFSSCLSVEFEAYRETLKKKFERLPEIARIKRHRQRRAIERGRFQACAQDGHGLKAQKSYHSAEIKSIGNKRRIMKEARQRKEMNRRKHSKPGSAEHEPMKQLGM